MEAGSNATSAWCRAGLNATSAWCRAGLNEIPYWYLKVILRIDLENRRPKVEAYVSPRSVKQDSTA